jgi:putative endonuclease
VTKIRKTLGQQGEELAVRYLQGKGYLIRCRNWRCPAGEIDIVAEKDNRLVFVEVRARRSLTCGSPEESITPSKQARLLEVAQSYLQETGQADREWQIDVIALVLARDGRPESLNHIENAVEG